jgi:hypothetical protein
MPLRFTILHLAQRFLIEEDTFMISFSFEPVAGHQLPGGLLFRFLSAKVSIIPELAFFVQTVFPTKV